MSNVKKPKTLPVLISELANSSSLADSIVFRIASYSLDSSIVETNETFRKEIEFLKLELARSRAIIRLLQDASSTIENSVKFTDEQGQSFLQSMTIAIQRLSLSEMRFGYTEAVLLAHPVQIRYLIALSLVNSCTLRNLQPEHIWQEIVSKQGVI